MIYLTLHLLSALLNYPVHMYAYYKNKQKWDGKFSEFSSFEIDHRFIIFVFACTVGFGGFVMSIINLITKGDILADKKRDMTPTQVFFTILTYTIIPLFAIRAFVKIKLGL